MSRLTASPMVAEIRTKIAEAIRALPRSDKVEALQSFTFEVPASWRSQHTDFLFEHPIVDEQGRQICQVNHVGKKGQTLTVDVTTGPPKQ